MNEYVRFVIITLVGAAIWVVLYWFIAREKLPLSSLIGIGVGGAAAGTFAGSILVSVFRVEDVFWAAWGYPLVISVGCAVGLQESLENWAGTSGGNDI
jgi:hypothetical protein